MGEGDKTISSGPGSGEITEPLPPGLIITLEVLEGPDKGARFEVKRARTILGRKEADIKLDDPTVSGRHAILEYAGGRLFLSDNKSTNGTKVNGERIDSSPVANMDELHLGDSKLLLSVVEDKYGAFMSEGADEDTGESRLLDRDEEESTVVTGALPNPPLPASIHVVLEVTDGPDKGRKFKVVNRSTTVGRAGDCDFSISDPTLSKRHFQIEIHNKDKMTVKDLASSNGTRLNDRYVSAVKIRHGDIVKTGDTVIKILIHVRV